MSFNWETVLITLIQALATICTTWINRCGPRTEAQPEKGQKKSKRSSTKG